MNQINKDFKEFGLPPYVLEGLTKLGFLTPTPIQAESIPAALSGRDILAIAPTGTGKTGAFGIPTLANLTTQKEKQLLVLAPTRELAAQIFKFLSSVLPSQKLKGALLVGGESIRRQYFDWQEGADFLVATPGRLMDHVGRGLDLKHVGMLVLDEVDRMLDMGFAPQIDEVFKMVPPERQTLFFSATIPPEIQKMVNRFLKEPMRITVGSTQEEKPKIREERVYAKGAEKIELLHKIIQEHTGKVLVFTQTKRFTERVAEELEKLDIRVARLHGDRTQFERTRSLDAYRRGIVRVMIATDVAARGIDVPDIEVVVNFDKAATREDYTHRIGRTGRYGKEGLAITFLDDRTGGARGPRGRQSRREERPRFSAPRVKPEPNIYAQAMRDSNPRNFGKKFDGPARPPQRKQWVPARRQDSGDGVSGTVRFFRNRDGASKFKRRSHIVEPHVVKPSTPIKSKIARGKKGAVLRRPEMTQ